MRLSIIVLCVCCVLPSCAYLLPEGRKCRQLRQEAAYWEEANRSRQAETLAARNRVETIKKEVAQLRARVERRAQQSPGSRSGELEALKKQLDSKQAELRQAELQLRLAH